MKPTGGEIVAASIDLSMTSPPRVGACGRRLARMDGATKMPLAEARRISGVAEPMDVNGEFPAAREVLNQRDSPSF